MKGNHSIHQCLPEKTRSSQTSPARAINTEVDYTTTDCISNVKKEIIREASKKLGVNQIWDFNSSFESNIMQHVREKSTTYSAGNIK